MQYGRYPNHFPHFFKRRLPLQLEELYLSSSLMDFAYSAIALFEPIYLWTLGYGIIGVMKFYLLVYIPYYFLVPLGGKFVARFGHERSIMLSTFALVAYYAALVAIKDAASLFYVAPFLLALQKALYWPGYHFDFMRFARKKEEGTEFSALWTLTGFVSTLGPVLGGIIIKFFGFQPLFLGASFVILLSSVPLFNHRAPPKRERYSYWKSLAMPFRRKYLRMTVGYLSLGEELLQLTIWPIMIATVVPNLLDVGLIVGAGMLVTSVVTLVVGKASDRSSKHHLLIGGGLLTGGVWLLRLVSRFPLFIFFTEAAGRISHNMTFVTMTTMSYERAHQDDLSWHGVLYEQGYAIAKTLAAALLILLAAAFDPFQAGFVLAALLSFLYIVF